MGALLGSILGFKFSLNRDRRAKAFSTIDTIFHFFFCISLGFGVLWVPLGSLLGPLEALLGGLKNEKMPTVQRENNFFINTVFWLYEAPNCPLGLILVPLWRIWSQNGSQNGYQKFSKK